MAKFMHGSQLEWDDALPLATYCYNIVPSFDILNHLSIQFMAGTHLKEDSTIFKTIVDMS